jgi:uncharacterized short protein YbdD (DUF466 family)
MRDDGLFPRVAAALRTLREAAHLMVGMPDYRRYLAHRHARHPDLPAMTRSEFVRERTRRRYDGSGPGRCC